LQLKVEGNRFEYDISSLNALSIHDTCGLFT
jgi:hypothetical protein